MELLNQVNFLPILSRIRAAFKFVKNEMLSWHRWRRECEKGCGVKRSKHPGEPITTSLDSESFPWERFSREEHGHKSRENWDKEGRRGGKRKGQKNRSGEKRRERRKRGEKKRRDSREQIKNWYSAQTDWIRPSSESHPIVIAGWKRVVREVESDDSVDVGGAGGDGDVVVAEIGAFETRRLN